MNESAAGKRRGSVERAEVFVLARTPRLAISDDTVFTVGNHRGLCVVKLKGGFSGACYAFCGGFHDLCEFVQHHGFGAVLQWGFDG